MTAPVPPAVPFGPDELAAVEALLAEAPALPWRLSDSNPGNAIRSDAEGRRILTTTSVPADRRLDLIVAAVNALPRLAAALRSAWAERDQAQAELAKSGFRVSPREAAALHRVLDSYLMTEEADPGLRDLRAVSNRLGRSEMDHSVYIAAYGQREEGADRGN